MNMMSDRIGEIIRKHLNHAERAIRKDFEMLLKRPLSSFARAPKEKPLVANETTKVKSRGARMDLRFAVRELNKVASRQDTFAVRDLKKIPFFRKYSHGQVRNLLHHLREVGVIRKEGDRRKTIYRFVSQTSEKSATLN